jgi:hypothetical protein
VNGRSIVNASGSASPGTPSRSVIEGVFDASQRTLVAADIINILSIPAKCIVEKVGYTIVTPEAVAAQTFSLGVVGTPTGWVVGAAGNASAVAGTSALGAGTLAAAGQFTTAATTIDLTVDAAMALTTLKVRVFAVVTFLG